MNNIKTGLLATTTNNHLLKLNLESTKIFHPLPWETEETKSHTGHWKYSTADSPFSCCSAFWRLLWCECAHCSAAVHPGGTKFCSRNQGKQSSRVHLPELKNTGSEAHSSCNYDGCCWAIHMIWDMLELNGKLSEIFEFSLVIWTSLSPESLQGWV